MLLQRSLTLRLTCLFSASAAITIFLLSLFLHNEMTNYFIVEDTHTLRKKAILVKDIIGKTNFNKEFSNIVSKMEQIEGVVVKIDDQDDKIVLYTSDRIQFPKNVINRKMETAIDYDTDLVLPDYSTQKFRTKPTLEHLKEKLFEWEDQKNLYRGMQFYFTLENSDQNSVLITLAMNINHHGEVLGHFKSVLIKFATIAVVISALFYWFITYYGLQPLKKLSRKAKLISGKDIKQRMPVEDLPIEIAGLSETLNNMLERLEGAFEQLENFSSDIAHELRTPINNLMTQTQVVLSKPRATIEYQMALGSNIEEFERLARMISDMLFLAKADNNQLILSAESLTLEKEIADLVEFYDALAEERDIRITFQGCAKIVGDKLMLRRAFSNLISNAINHSHQGSEIKIKLSTDNSNAVVEFTNSGHTIPADVLPHLFHRFYRADKARTCSANEGVGLGLAITQSIARAHSGDISVNSKNEITTFTLSLNTNINSQA